MVKSLYVKRNKKNRFVRKRRVFSRRRLGQVAYLSGRKELVMQRRIRNRFICQKGKGSSKRI
jgi:hypothetical protein